MSCGAQTTRQSCKMHQAEEVITPERHEGELYIDVDANN